MIDSNICVNIRLENNISEAKHTVKNDFTSYITTIKYDTLMRKSRKVFSYERENHHWLKVILRKSFEHAPRSFVIEAKYMTTALCRYKSEVRGALSLNRVEPRQQKRLCVMRIT